MMTAQTVQGPRTCAEQVHTSALYNALPLVAHLLLPGPQIASCFACHLLGHTNISDDGDLAPFLSGLHRTLLRQLPVCWVHSHLQQQGPPAMSVCSVSLNGIVHLPGIAVLLRLVSTKVAAWSAYEFGWLLVSSHNHYSMHK
jgi:hypothetical protein